MDSRACIAVELRRSMMNARRITTLARRRVRKQGSACDDARRARDDPVVIDRAMKKTAGTLVRRAMPEPHVDAYPAPEASHDSEAQHDREPASRRSSVHVDA